MVLVRAHHSDSTPQLPHLHVVEDEEESLNREPLKELKGVKMGRRVLMVVVGCGVWCSLQVWPVSVYVCGVQVCASLCVCISLWCMCVYMQKERESSKLAL